MIDPWITLTLDLLCLGFSFVFFWSMFLVVAGIIRPAKRHPSARTRLRFAVLVCARNEERVIRLPVKSVLMGKYPAECREVIVLADNCSDKTVENARKAGATVWEKTCPSRGKGDVLAWGVDRVRKEGRFDAVAVFDADNIASESWFNAVNDALQDGETVVTGRRHSSNATANVIAGWYTVYWAVMNELSNRVRTNLGLSGKLTGTGFAFLLSALGPEGWKTSTLVEDVEFSIQTNLAGRRVAYVPDADYADEQPETWPYMWRQLRRWTTGGWQVLVRYLLPWLCGLCRRPSMRLFDSYFSILTGTSVAFIHLFNVIAFVYKLCRGVEFVEAGRLFFGIVGFVCLMSWFMAVAAIALSAEKRRPKVVAVVTFPVFSLILSASVIFTMIFPTRQWKPIPHGEAEKV